VAQDAPGGRTIANLARALPHLDGAMTNTPTPSARRRTWGADQSGSTPHPAGITSEHEIVPPRAAITWKGRYVLGAVLGEGGTGVVHEARDLVLDRVVALKEIRAADELSGQLLAHEARALASVDHPAVVRVYTVYPDHDPPFIVMERARGRVLSSILAGGRLPVARTLHILRQVASGLDALHAASIVHGDVKPANILVEDDGTAKLIDAGLAPFLERVLPGEVLGTPSYLAPERASATVTPPGLGPRSDVYSLGVLAFEMLTGRLPFAGPTASDLVRAHITQRPPMPSSVAGLSTEFDAPMARALAKRPEQRTPTCGALVEALDHAAKGADAQGRRLRVLVADDDEGTRMLLMSVLGAYLPGASVVLCGSGATVMEAVEALPSIAVLDLGMPDPSGIELVRRVRARSPGTAIVIVTGRGSGTEREAARALGVRHFVVKPFEVEELVRAIHEAVGRDVLSFVRPVGK
jgi:eukaryotic-like serine/threonine-protein kinase